MPALTSIACVSTGDAIRLAAALAGTTGADSIEVNNAVVELRWHTTAPPLPAAALATAKATAGLSDPPSGRKLVNATHSSAGVVTHG